MKEHTGFEEEKGRVGKQVDHIGKGTREEKKIAFMHTWDLNNASVHLAD